MVQVHHDQVQGRWGGLKKYSRIGPDAMNDFPDFLRRISKLRLTLRCCGLHSTGRDGFREVYYIHALVSSLMESHRLESLHIALDLPERTSRDEFSLVLDPFTRLRDIESFTLSGGPYPEMEDELQ